MTPERDSVMRCRPGLIRRLAILLVLVLAWSEAEAGEPSEHTRIRTVDAEIRQLIVYAPRHSPTFKALVDTIDRSDGLVYVERGRCGHGVRACLPLSVTVAGPNRILRIRLDPRKTGRNLVSSLAHELQHATELLSDPTVVSVPAMYFYYANRALMVNGIFETHAAIAAGNAVHAELNRRPVF